MLEIYKFTKVMLFMRVMGFSCSSINTESFEGY